MKDKICITIPNLHGAGCERMLSEVLPYYADAFNVDLVLAENKVSYLVPDSVNIISLELPLNTGGVANKVLTALKVIFRLSKITKHGGYDAIVSYLDFFNVMAVIANSFRRQKKKHIAVEQTTDYEFFANSKMPGWKQAIFKAVVGWAYNRVDRVISVSQNLKNFLVHELGVKREVTVIHNGVDTSKFDLAPAEDTQNIDDRFLDASLRLLCISRLDHQKNILFLLDSFAAASVSIPEAKLFILGSGPLKQAIEDRIDLLNLRTRAYLLGFTDRPENYLKLCDLFVLASRYESFGNVVIEALACGVPVVTTNYGVVVKEILQSDGLGTVVEQGDVNGFAEAMIKIVNDRDLYDRKALNEYARSHFDAAAKAHQYVSVLQEVIVE